MQISTFVYITTTWIYLRLTSLLKKLQISFWSVYHKVWLVLMGRVSNFKSAMTRHQSNITHHHNKQGYRFNTLLLSSLYKSLCMLVFTPVCCLWSIWRHSVQTTLLSRNRLRTPFQTWFFFPHFCAPNQIHVNQWALSVWCRSSCLLKPSQLLCFIKRVFLPIHVFTIPIINLNTGLNCYQPTNFDGSGPVWVQQDLIAKVTKGTENYYSVRKQWRVVLAKLACYKLYLTFGFNLHGSSLDCMDLCVGECCKTWL